MRIKREIKKRDGKKKQVEEPKAKKANTNILHGYRTFWVKSIYLNGST